MKLHSIDEFFKSPAGIDFIIEDRINSKMTNNTQPSQQVPVAFDVRGFNWAGDVQAKKLCYTDDECLEFIAALVEKGGYRNFETIKLFDVAQSPAASDAGLADDAKRFVFEHTQHEEMLTIGIEDISTPGPKDINWWREKIDAALASQEPQHG